VGSPPRVVNRDGGGKERKVTMRKKKKRKKRENRSEQQDFAREKQGRTVGGREGEMKKEKKAGEREQVRSTKTSKRKGNQRRRPIWGRKKKKRPASLGAVAARCVARGKKKEGEAEERTPARARGEERNDRRKYAGPCCGYVGGEKGEKENRINRNEDIEKKKRKRTDLSFTMRLQPLKKRKVKKGHRRREKGKEKEEKWKKMNTLLPTATPNSKKSGGRRG